VRELIEKKIMNKELEKKMKEYSEEEMQRVSRAFGCVIGAFVGDALGAYLEMRKEVTDKLVEEALQMNGGGPLKTGPGQITDDSEMAMCLLHSLNCFQEKAYDEDKDCGLD
jgi:ADP-ribosylglycohydrolase